MGRTASYEELAAVKALLTRRLSVDGSAVLIDPDYGYSVAEPDVRPDRGLLITLEDFRFEETSGWPQDPAASRTGQSPRSSAWAPMA